MLFLKAGFPPRFASNEPTMHAFAPNFETRTSSAIASYRCRIRAYRAFRNERGDFFAAPVCIRIAQVQ